MHFPWLDRVRTIFDVMRYIPYHIYYLYYYQVQCRYKGLEAYYPGSIAKIYDDGTCDVKYDDGHSETKVKGEG